MKQIEKHPAPEKLLQQITEAAINALALGALGLPGLGLLLLLRWAAAT